MTMEPIEPTLPQQASPNPAFRRRRRKRKGASNNNQQASQPSTQNASPSAQGQGNPRSNGAPQGQRPGKKRFFKKQSNGGANPGNNQQQRRNKQGGRQPRTFVGPMDHSYRAANGNYAEAPPSTTELQRGNSNGNYNGNHNGYGSSHAGLQPVGLPNEDFAGQGTSGVAGIAAPIEVPTRIYCFIEDLFFLAKIQETARKLGVKVVFVKNDKDIVQRLADAPELERPALIVFDLNNANAKPLTLIPKLKAKLKRTASVIGFLSHLQGDLKVKATEAGCDVVMPRSAFSQNLPNLLRRYGVEDEVEYQEA
ncbi:MAG TPA: hypothetical protein VMU62_02535 [Acidobacteriaceae bacterium]|nr:hypothetical protein [Acidobacteriaceae bacterium]